MRRPVQLMLFIASAVCRHSNTYRTQCS